MSRPARRYISVVLRVWRHRPGRAALSAPCAPALAQLTARAARAPDEASGHRPVSLAGRVAAGMAAQWRTAAPRSAGICPRQAPSDQRERRQRDRRQCRQCGHAHRLPPYATCRCRRQTRTAHRPCGRRPTRQEMFTFPAIDRVRSANATRGGRAKSLSSAPPTAPYMAVGSGAISLSSWSASAPLQRRPPRPGGRTSTPTGSSSASVDGPTARPSER